MRQKQIIKPGIHLNLFIAIFLIDGYVDAQVYVTLYLHQPIVISYHYLILYLHQPLYPYFNHCCLEWFWISFFRVILRLLFDELSLRIIILFFVNYSLSNEELMSHQLTNITAMTASWHVFFFEEWGIRHGTLFKRIDNVPIQTHRRLIAIHLASRFGCAREYLH